ncbi:MAG: heavy metal translocating P-type ATPase [Pirellulaceae bacterium]|nr:heavy metal translocating P-type ATPase [Pirellulaceae bacterium]
MTAASARVAVCDYCGLPLPGWGPEPAADDQPRYCCFGCKLAAAITAERGAEGHARSTLTRLGLSVFFSMNVMVFTLVLWTWDAPRPGQLADNPAAGERVAGERAAGSDPAADVFFQLLRYLCLLFSAPVLLLLAGPLLESAWQQLQRRAGVTDLLLVLGVAAAFGYSLVSVLRGSGHVYFEVACMVLVFVTLGRWLEATGKLKTTSVLRSLERLLPDRVRVLRDGEVVELPADQVRAGDTLRVLAGERIAIDGLLVRNQGAIDQQAVTGESTPVVKRPGDRVLSGTLNLDGDLWIEASAAAGSSTMQQVIAAVEQAALRGERYQRLADRVAGWFLPLVLVIAAATFGLHAAWHGWQAGLLASLAVILIACPCALGLATPMALWAALGRACQGQILFRDGDALTRLAATRWLFLDKTGTLTTGLSEVEQLILDPDTPGEQVLQVAAALAAGSSHPVSAAVGRYAARHISRVGSAESTSPLNPSNRISNPCSLAGRGVTGHVESLDQPAWLGSPRWMAELGQQPLAADNHPGAHDDHPGLHGPAEVGPRDDGPLDDHSHDGGGELSQVCLAWGGRVRAVFKLREQLRGEAVEALAGLRHLGCSVEILSGDERRRVDRLARSLGIAAQGDLLPDAKLRVIEHARRQGVVVMVGDGINDAPALAAADVGVAMGSGTDISRHSAAVCLLGNDLLRLPWAIGLARQTVRIVRWNLLWAFGYNSVGVLLAAAGWLNPMVAAAAMVGSSVLVVTNSLRLARFELSPSLPDAGPGA